MKIKGCFTLLVGLLVIGQVAAATSLEQRLSMALSELQSQYRLSGTLQVTTPKASFAGSIGNANDATGTLNTSDTIFLIASNTKQFVAAAILKLEEMDKLKTSDPLWDHIHEYPKVNLQWADGAPVTIEHLVHHTSGISDAYDDEKIKAKLFKEPIEFSEILRAVANQPLLAKPGETWAYNNTAYILLGEVIRRASGLTFSDFVTEHLFSKAAMHDTSVGYPKGKLNRVARSYELEENGRTNFRHKHTILEDHVTDIFTDGNILSTAPNLSRWCLELTSGRILSQASITKMFLPSNASIAAGNPYGYGWIVSKDSSGRIVYFHSGLWLNYISNVFVFPDSQETVIWLSNQVPTQEAHSALIKRVLSELHPVQ